MIKCSWCGATVTSSKVNRAKRYCNASHRQMAWAKRTPAYTRRQHEATRRKRNNGIRLVTNLQFIQAAEMIANDKDLLTI